jgi:hypothetical protein
MKHGALIAGLLLSLFAPPLRADSRELKALVAPFDLLPTKHMVVMVKINGKGPYRMIFDTGAPVSLLNSKIAKTTGVQSKNNALSGFSLFGQMDQAKIKKLEIGDLKAEFVPVIVMDHPTVEVVSKILGPIEGILGFPFFARYKMTLDYQAKKMTFVSNGFEPTDILQALMVSLMAHDKPSATVLAPAGLWGLVLHKENKDEEPGLTIREVFAESSAARAGLQAGDRLLVLDDYWTDSLADCYLAASHVKPGTEAKVLIERKGRKIEFIVKPQAGF